MKSATSISMNAPSGGGPRVFLRLSLAEVMKLGYRRGMILACLALTLGSMVIAIVVAASMHAINPVEYGPVGGIKNYKDAIGILELLAAPAAVLIGAAAGAGDLEAGFFRSMVLTGRSRLVLFLARIPAATAVLLAILAPALALVAIASASLTGGLPAPSADLLTRASLWVIFDGLALLLVALGIGSLLGSRATTLGLVIPLQVVIAPALQDAKALGWVRDLILGVATRQLAPFGAGPAGAASMSAVAVLFVVGAWLLVTLGLGAWRTATRDA